MSIAEDHPRVVPGWADRVQYPFPDQYMTVEGGRMHYVDVGRGEPILFLHGLPTWSFIYRYMIRSLATDYRCVAPDFIGFGLSDKPDGWSYSPLDQYRNLCQLICHLQLENITLVLHDYGAPIGMSYAVENPHNVKRIVIFNSFCWDMRGDDAADRIVKIASGACGKLLLEATNGWSRIVRRTFGDRETYTEAFERAIAGPIEKRGDRQGVWTTAKNLISSSPFFEEAWHRCNELEEMPIQLLWGMKDPSFGLKALDKWWHKFPLADVVKFETAGHFPMEEKSADVMRAVKEFMLVSRRSAVPYLG